VPVVVSNQRGVARELVSTNVLREIEQRIRLAGGSVEAFYYCLHDHGDQCSCRKPEPGLLLDAAQELDLNLAASVMVGDSESDVVAGARAGVHTVLITSSPAETSADARAADLFSAAELVVRLWGRAEPRPT
jgi:D-glycero-D-manno-heptose 1,7-bisphosphate phosphatase